MCGSPLRHSSSGYSLASRSTCPLYCGHFWPIVPAPDDRWGWLWSNWWNEDWQGKTKYSEKTCPSATLSTTNPTWPDPGSNQGRRCGKTATNRLSYGAANPVVTTYNTSFSILKQCIQPTECLCVFRMIMTINSYGFSEQRQPVGLCSRGVTCVLRGTYWIFVRYLESI
jgi:hypothetical protein